VFKGLEILMGKFGRVLIWESVFKGLGILMGSKPALVKESCQAVTKEDDFLNQ